MKYLITGWVDERYGQRDDECLLILVDDILGTLSISKIYT